MIYYIVENYAGEIKALTPNEKLAKDIAESDDIILVHDTNMLKIIFDENKVTLENKRLIKGIDVEIETGKRNTQLSKKRFKEVVNGIKDTRTGRLLTSTFEITFKLNEINDLYDWVLDINEEITEKNNILTRMLERIFKEHNLDMVEEIRKGIIDEFSLNHGIDQIKGD